MKLIIVGKQSRGSEPVCVYNDETLTALCHICLTSFTLTSPVQKMLSNLFTDPYASYEKSRPVSAALI